MLLLLSLCKSRVGNTAFAEHYVRVVPDTWHVINDQDIVPHGGKLWGLYKRNGHRVLMNPGGDILVRPNPLESRLLSAGPFGGRVLDHFLSGR